MVMDADGFFQLHDMFAWQPIRVSRVTNPNWLPCKRIVELEETVSIHNHAKGVPDATMTSVAFQLASGPKEPLKKKKRGHFTVFFFSFSGSFGPDASWNATDVIVTSGPPFCMVMDADGFFQLHDMFAWQPIRVCNPTNPNWLPCKYIVELEETVSIHNHAKGVPDATMTSVAFQLASGPREPLKKKTKKCGHFTVFFFFQRLFWTGCEFERN